MGGQGSHFRIAHAAGDPGPGRSACLARSYLPASSRLPSYWPGPLTVRSRRLDSFLSPSAQMAPCASQSVVAGRVIVTSPLESGLTTISHRRFLPLTSRRAPVTVPPSTVKAWSRIVV